MDPDLIKAWFATYIVGISLIRVLDESEYFRVTAMKLIWGRSRGLLFHFLADIVAPVLFAMVYFCRAILSMSA
jgi:hypothetical protein